MFSFEQWILPGLAGVAFLQGLAGSLHCAGMCGPFVHSLNSRGSSLIINIVYNFGRSLSYVGIGLILGLAGSGVNAFFASPVAAVLGGLLIAYFGLTYLFPGRLGARWFMHLPAGFARFFGRLLGRAGDGEPSATANIVPSFLFGLVSGLLPCGLLYPAYALALSSGGILSSAGIMFAFSLGTYPALLAVGLSSGMIWRRMQTPALRVVMGTVMILLGVFMIYHRLYHPHVHGDSGHVPGDGPESHHHMHHSGEL